MSRRYEQTSRSISPLYLPPSDLSDAIYARETRSQTSNRMSDSSALASAYNPYSETSRRRPRRPSTSRASSSTTRADLTRNERGRPTHRGQYNEAPLSRQTSTTTLTIDETVDRLHRYFGNSENYHPQYSPQTPTDQRHSWPDLERVGSRQRYPESLEVLDMPIYSLSDSGVDMQECISEASWSRSRPASSIHPTTTTSNFELAYVGAWLETYHS
ncbi:hypothetical protein H072_10040 [Dactylellina haptotyla CBS 200.50]|uniref:Uncharacterized protein n=1 Tax=Dactylellina haptotyla (strain CBS 200.50) TaxID=1284197 RepID=S8A0D4_DACHA|nr:hypothetical protein H072_10040 [Dactylellina haptotyla CBS 200.50]